MNRVEFQEELDLLSRRVELLFGEVENSLQRAVTALVERDERLASETVSHDDLIDNLVLSTEEAVVQIIARQAPVAGDLRYLLSVLRISADLERCGDLSLRVAKQVFDRTWIARAESLTPYIMQLGEKALATLHAAAQAWSDRDGDAWQEIEEIDVDIDSLYGEFLDLLEKLDGPHTGRIAVHSMIAGQALERIADHSVCIAQRIRYLVTGQPEGLAGEIAP